MQPRCICLAILLATPLMGCASEPQAAGPQEQGVAQKGSELSSDERLRMELDELACMLAKQQVETQRERRLRREAEKKLAHVELELRTALDDKADTLRRLDQTYLDLAKLQRAREAPVVVRIN
jgi:hypothetical protein